ncbi:TPA: hypothetical protein ONC33_001174 [Enterobacter kobei]|nr:hypothetical protein [Enterobacter kobei]HCR1949314.1 hypothetical protein [Enterobacter kobei]HDS7848623.1 hypothetical protein [Enterobacter kobei]
MSNIDKHARADDESTKTYYIHPMAFGSTQDPGHGHVPVVKADEAEKLRAKLEAAEKRIAELEAREVTPEVGVMNIGNPYCEDRLVAWTVAGKSLPPGIYYLEAVRSGSVGVED